MKQLRQKVFRNGVDLVRIHASQIVKTSGATSDELIGCALDQRQVGEKSLLTLPAISKLGGKHDIFESIPRFPDLRPVDQDPEVLNAHIQRRRLILVKVGHVINLSVVRVQESVKVLHVSTDGAVWGGYGLQESSHDFACRCVADLLRFLRRDAHFFMLIVLRHISKVSDTVDRKLVVKLVEESHTVDSPAG
eukprot:CAMPEP_0181220288 /NCGR_PEP_ID=MMETSP1096-20121128/28756_1 /TAXON_ID=156174 ORGANISM="Chrysochromulina ericina, Strain CCMP281" /NCGR_SAMPLE_ID=MMETSP1096 /ASSEMBLY_ACC=CAM_ASM_000453 /LENGTH=191 /DNA_ID=CAMNT_0023312779 /DNA_START=396 /DNA_END=971 /DNA_ORIENTATION=+